MAERGRTQQGELAALMDALAESGRALDDGAVLAESRARGEDPVVAAEAVRSMLRDTGKRYRQRRLRAAAAEYRRASERLSTRWVDLPDGVDERRSLLASIFARHPEMTDAFLTVQHRELRELTDADVESCLAQMLELGVFDDEGS
jgi:Mg2+ and Co2+ transporter CorA